jgi:hypothetical protein
LIAVAQTAGSRREKQQAKPLAIRIEHGIPKPFADWIWSAQIMVCVEEFARSLDFLARRERFDTNVTQQTLAGRPFRWMVRGGVLHPAIRKNPAGVVQRFDSKCSSRMFWKYQRMGADLAAVSLAGGRFVPGVVPG